MKKLLIGIIIVAGVFSTRGQVSPPEMPNALFVLAKDIKWERMEPELGRRSAEIAFLHIDPITKATQLMIRIPPGTYVPKHWHSANETHTILSGTFVMVCEGKRVNMNAGSFNYTPAKMIHEGWTTKTAGTLLFITVDGAWDINWVEDSDTKPSKK